MKTEKVVSTYKDGVLTSSKRLDVEGNPPVHPQGLIRTEAMQHALNVVLRTHDEVAKAVSTLRKQLIASERATKARTKERDALKKAYQALKHRNESLEEKNEDLKANLFAAREDLKFLEQARKLPVRRPGPQPKEFNTSTLKAISDKVKAASAGMPTNYSPTNPNPKPQGFSSVNYLPPRPKPDPAPPQSRSIAAKPVKR